MRWKTETHIQLVDQAGNGRAAGKMVAHSEIREQTKEMLARFGVETRSELR